MIVLSDAAKARIQRFVQKEAGVGVQIGVNRSGCSGFGYEVNVIKAPLNHQQEFDFVDFKVFVDNKDMVMLTGLSIDVEKKGLNEVFVFHNPQAEASCGCGSSFSLKKG